MKTILCSALLLALAASSGLAQGAASDINAANASTTQVGATPRDGFTIRGTDLVITRKGVTTKVEREMLLPGGIRVMPNGTILRADGSKATLGPNQLLTLDGQVQNVILTPEGVAPMSSVDTAPAAKAEVRSSAFDGITVAAGQAYLTRGGMTQRVMDDVRLRNGAVVKPNGTVTMATGNVFSLKAGQKIDLDGVLHEAPTGP